MCRILSDRFVYCIILVILLVQSLKAERSELTEVVSNVNKLSDVTKNRNRSEVYPDTSLQVQRNKPNNPVFVNETFWTNNITEMEYCRRFFGSDPDDGNSYCNMTWDGLSCWPATMIGEFAVIQCPQNMHGVDGTQNATRFCTTNGTWAQKSDYNSCLIDMSSSGLVNGVEPVHEFARRIIFNLGFSISTITLLIALFIFLYFRSLRCLRNIIHSHLIASFILRNILWMLLQHTLLPIVNADQKWACKMEVAIYNYAQMTNFFWMLVEGLYLHIIIVWTYSADKIRKWYFLIIGWCVPAVIVSIWVTARTQVKEEDTNDITTGCFMPKKAQAESKAEKLDYIYMAPIMFVLAVNIIFLGSIIWILVTKLRSSHSLEHKQLRKAVKATITLFPLLGITYVIFIWPPSDDKTFVEVHQYINAVLQSFQGFFVALFYCFLNEEVKTVLKKKMKMFKDNRALSTRYTKTSMVQDMSITGRDSIAPENGKLHSGRNGFRFTSSNKNQYNDDEMCESENML